MLASFKRSLQAARCFEAVQDAATQALPGLQRARGLDRSEIAEVLTLYTGGNQLSLALQTQPSRAHPDPAQPMHPSELSLRFLPEAPIRDEKVALLGVWDNLQVLMELLGARSGPQVGGGSGVLLA